LNRLARILGWAIVLPAAFMFSTWSLYVVAHDHYRVPALLAAFAGVVYDGAALLALDAWSTAAKDPLQSTLRPRMVAVGLLTTSIFLNITHASIAHQGVPAAVLYAGPGIVLWAMAELRLGAQHAARRHQIGMGYEPRPAYGIDAWVVRRGRAWRAYTGHIEARLDRITPTNLVDNINEVPQIEAADSQVFRPDAAQVNGPHHATLTAAITAAATTLGADASAQQIADLIAENHRLEIDPGYIRTVRSRESKKPTAGTDGVGQGGGGYA
jgi:hypothetical protein